MGNLSAEQIKKALEKVEDTYIYLYNGTDGLWHEVRYSHILALINSQEQRIKELTENSQEQYDEGFVKGYNTASEALADQAKQIEILTRALDAKCDECIARERADTVRKMQERLHEQFHDRVAYTRSYVHDTIDQIAKEMLEENENETTHSN